MSVDRESAASHMDMTTNSTYDMGFGDSDLESLSSDSGDDGIVPKDYWFGRKYFECVMAQDLLQQSTLHEGVASINVAFFPYSLCPSRSLSLT
jgi:hypothetical protein